MKHVVRLITFQPGTAHSQPLLNELKLLCLNDCYKIECAKFMHDIIDNKLDKILCNLFQLTKKT